MGSTHTNTTVTSCSSASPPGQQAGDQGLEGPWRASAEATSRKMELGALRWVTRLLTQAQRVLPSSGLDGFHSEITTFTDLRSSLKTHHIVGYWGYFQQGGNSLSLSWSLICLPTVIGIKVMKCFTARSTELSTLEAEMQEGKLEVTIKHLHIVSKEPR